MTTIKNAINHATTQLSVAGITTARLDAEVLLSHIAKKDRAWLFTHIHDAIDDTIRGIFEAAIQRRAQRVPLQYLIGKQEFWGLEFTVSPDVLIPRPETEQVIELALKIIGRAERQITIIDLCTGSGCIAISLAKEIKTARIFAVDKSGRALDVARENARKHGIADHGPAWFLQGDLFQPLEKLDIRGQVDIIVSNPPYIQSEDYSTLQPEVRDYEPEMALVAGPQGTEIHRRIIAAAPGYLKRHGALILEMGLGQADMLVDMVKASDAFTAPAVFKDLAGIERVIVARRNEALYEPRMVANVHE